MGYIFISSLSFFCSIQQIHQLADSKLNITSQSHQQPQECSEISITWILFKWFDLLKQLFTDICNMNLLFN